MFSRIVTHNDLDGIFSASICAAIHGITDIVFTGPNIVSRKGYLVTENDVVCDLPYPGECGLWFDHHEGNLEELKRLGNDIGKIPGRFAPAKSCARVIYDYYKEGYELPDFYQETVSEIDKIDSFDYSSVEEWRRETPSRIINDSIKAPFKTLNAEEEYFRSLILRLAEKSINAVSWDTDVKQCYQDYLKLEEKMLDTIRQVARFHNKDKLGEFAIIDLTGFSKRIAMTRNLAQIIFPEIKGVFLIQNLFDRGVKTNNLKISGSLTIKNGQVNKDIGEIMRTLNIGDGHRGAGSGQIFSRSKDEMIKKQGHTLDRIYKIWSEQK
jgi:oligoribonuclease NrnB/cAMP/cGMP phosphodiesterase (DHH superfamily)